MKAPGEPDLPDLSWLRGLTQRRMTRRDLLRHAGQGAGALGIAAFLAACSIPGTRGEEEGRPQPLPALAGELLMANWVAYIDKDHGVSQTLTDFRDQFGVDMTYQEAINANEEFFGTIREPLSQGQATGWDIIVLTDWLIAKLIRLGYLEQLHHDRIPNFRANAVDKFIDPPFDPDNAHSIPWAAGITGIGYNRALTGRDVTSIEDLFDPAFEGHVGMFLEMRDTFGLILLSMGIDPPDATVDDVEAAQGRLLQQRDAGIVRGYYGNDYLDQLAQGNLWATMAWSGDVLGLSVDSPDLQFVIPQEGGMRWSDNMCIPAGAEHPTDAHLWMDYVYRPDVATRITEWVWYESPVEQVADLVAQHAQEDPGLSGLAASDTVFPTPEITDQTHAYKFLDGDEEEIWNDLFQQVTQG